MELNDYHILRICKNILFVAIDLFYSKIKLNKYFRIPYK